MPAVPNVPGVPPLLSYAANAVTLLAADAIAFLVGQTVPQWGLFKDGFPVVVADTVASFDYRQGWAIADYPVENGGFESYDKVAQPFNVRLRYAAGGSEGARQALLDSVAAIAGTLTLFEAVTPEAIYQNVNVERYDYKRTSTNGLGMIVIDVWCQEVRVSAQSTFTSTKTPSGASAVNGGTVQTQAATAGQAAQAAGAQ